VVAGPCNHRSRRLSPTRSVHRDDRGTIAAYGCSRATPPVRGFLGRHGIDPLRLARTRGRSPADFQPNSGRIPAELTPRLILRSLLHGSRDTEELSIGVVSGVTGPLEEPERQGLNQCSRPWPLPATVCKRPLGHCFRGRKSSPGAGTYERPMTLRLALSNKGNQFSPPR
jgi:hypothetical protein